MALHFPVDETLINAMLDAGRKGFELGGKTLTAVSIGTALPPMLADVTGIVGIAGAVNGSIFLNMSMAVALRLASGILMEEFTSMTDEALDSIAEAANVVGGRLKSSLANSGYPLENITLPSVVIGNNYWLSHSKGMLAYCVSFHVDDDKIHRHTDRVVTVAMTLMTTQLKRNPAKA